MQPPQKIKEGVEEKLWLIGGNTDWEHDCNRLLHSSNKEDGGKDSLEYVNDKEEGRRQHRWRKSCSLLCKNASTEPIIALLRQSKYSDLSLHPFDLPNPPHCCYPPLVDDVEGERGTTEWKKKKKIYGVYSNLRTENKERKRPKDI